MLVDPISSTEVNRSKVGETEHLLMELFERANFMPHLLCCIAIDEIDALTPKRNEKSGQYKVDVLCLLLSLIGGIKDFPNVFVIASTNRLNKMDEAICRRLQTKFFVGRLNQQKRLDMLLKLNELAINGKQVTFPAKLETFTQQLTLNFSGAAVESFRSRIVTYLNSFESDSPVLPPINEDKLTEIANQVARDFQISIGSSTIPGLLGRSQKSPEIKINEKKNYTGRMLIDMSNESDCSVQLEYVVVDENGLRCKKVDAKKIKNMQLVHEIVPSLIKMCIKVNADFIQMFDTSMLLSNAAFDENTVMETVLEKIGEWEQYRGSMAIFDVDSFIGVSENISDSSMGESTSYSISNNKMWHQLVIQTFNSKLDDATGQYHKWVVMITKNSFVASQFKSLVKFPLTDHQKETEKENQKIRTCANVGCGSPYTNSKNNIDSCSYHDGQLVRYPVENLNSIVHIDAKTEFPSIFLKNSKTANKQDANKSPPQNSFIYLCCYQAFGSAGCKKGKHSEKEIRNHEKYLENIHSLASLR